VFELFVQSTVYERHKQGLEVASQLRLERAVRSGAVVGGKEEEEEETQADTQYTVNS